MARLRKSERLGPRQNRPKSDCHFELGTRVNAQMPPGHTYTDACETKRVFLLECK